MPIKRRFVRVDSGARGFELGELALGKIRLPIQRWGMPGADASLEVQNPTKRKCGQPSRYFIRL